MIELLLSHILYKVLHGETFPAHTHTHTHTHTGTHTSFFILFLPHRGASIFYTVIYGHLVTLQPNWIQLMWTGEANWWSRRRDPECDRYARNVAQPQQCDIVTVMARLLQTKPKNVPLGTARKHTNPMSDFGCRSPLLRCLILRFRRACETNSVHAFSTLTADACGWRVRPLGWGNRQKWIAHGGGARHSNLWSHKGTDSVAALRQVASVKHQQPVTLSYVVAEFNSRQGFSVTSNLWGLRL